MTETAVLIATGILFFFLGMLVMAIISDWLEKKRLEKIKEFLEKLEEKGG